MTSVPRIYVEHGPRGPAWFAGASGVIVAQTPAEVGPALERADAARAAGAWVAGWIAYEAGAAFEPRLGGVMRGPGPLLALGVFPEGPRAGGLGGGGAARLSVPEPVVARGDYDRAIGRVLGYIAAGDCYQVNLTFPLASRLEGEPLDLFRRLRGTGGPGHAAYAEMGVGPVVASLSPELFFRVDGEGRVVARPMKGTAPRDPDPARDAALAAELRASVKARAENLMIVDLLRNDIGRLARPGSVRVPALYAIEPYATVHQMTSTVEGELCGPASLARLMPALFPCGSVTGAPKIRAMQVIRELEPHPRGVYCGAVGWMAPDGRCDFSVAIRTLSIVGRDVTVNVGGGVVADSTADGEWEEALWKARFLGPALDA
ncbi:aminodeoxychorismate synthase component I [Rubellimicrobium aerolatum]|uniref:Aminodeoxychorismate synthase component I n=1 Tax=Rubellimicrobium aerolatum TaxID=490979 RepID=A0ABW0SF61_9RHOB|nr:aminodeoxychorismate synthase component I [Rubellimicrobium aerolatum]MBP1805688.1 para-aminobenzoate synthetase component 1 [Rubellimicrobium aerolatum]